ncbi:MAG: HAD-IC family P-type ATPase [Candidatus Dojkabacteria bacterium]|nr:MAG: HAD-IC family P-type ATPase [Candidatus Dojkabacteria bacterium]
MDQSQKNVLVQERVVSPLSLLVNQLKSPLVFVLIFAALITTALAEYVDTLFILVAIAINSALGFYQEYKAENTLQQLKKLINPKAVIVRNGKKFTIELAEVMVGDIAELTIEHQIPADGELVEAMGLTVNEAILTGESVPVHKSHGDMIYAGTRLLTGHGYMKVKSIGGNTSIGKIGASVSSISDTKTPLQHQLGKLARYLSIIAALCAALLFLVGLLYGYELSEISTTAVAVAVASIPEGLVVTLTVILAVGMQKVSKQQAIVRKLLAAETLGSVTTVCVDKTGTVTEGVLNVVQEDFIDNDLAYRSIRLSENGSDPLEIAMRQWLEKKHSSQVVSGSWEVSEKVVDGIPFNSKQKYTALLGESSGGKILYLFGAPEVLLDKSTIDKNSRELWEARIAEYASKGKKVIGFAHKEYKENKKLSKKDISQLEWNGLLALDDPIRQGVIESIRECQSAGINFKMITGDYLETGIAVMKQLGLLDESDHARRWHRDNRCRA